MGCRSVKTLLSANQEELWDDIQLKIAPDLISDSDHHVATIRKKNRTKASDPNPDLRVGEILCFDVVPNPAKTSLTGDTYYKNYLLAVDKKAP